MNLRFAAAMAVSSFCALAVTIPAHAAFYQIQPEESDAGSQDTMVTSTFPDDNFEYGTFLKSVGASKTSNGHDASSLIQFPLTALSADSVAAADVSAAKLRLYSIKPSFGASLPVPNKQLYVTISQLAAAWDETTVTWNTIPATVGGTAVTTEVPGIDQWIELDVTSLVKNWLNNPASNFGMLLAQSNIVLSSTGAQVGATFSSSGVTDASLRPMLQINTVPEPSSLFLLAVAGMAVLRLRRRR